MTAAASDLVRAEWRHRVEAEYRSAAITQHLGLWLIQIGASPDLIRDALAIVDDELIHAELSHQVFTAAGGRAARPIDRHTLGLGRDPERPLEEAVLRAGVRFYCLGETVAVPLFVHLRASCEQEDARATLDRIVVDEVRHRDFGWALLDWLLSGPSADEHRQLIERELPGMFAELDESYGSGALADDDDDDAFAAADRAWGLAPPREYAAILERTFERDYAPRFASRDIDAEPAWQNRTSSP